MFQILAIRLEGRVLNPGTGTQMFRDFANLVFLLFPFSVKRRDPKGFIDCLHFQTKTAIADATAPFKHRSPALERTDSERILSDNLILVIDLAAHLMALLISSVMMLEPLSSGSSLLVSLPEQRQEFYPSRVHSQTMIEGVEAFQN